MKKKYVVKENREFQEIISKGRKFVSRYYVIYFLPAEDVRFGISVGKKVGKAVVRNKVKRQIRAILRDLLNLKVKNGHYIIIVKKSVLDVKFEEMKNDLEKSFKKAKIVVDDYTEKRG